MKKQLITTSGNYSLYFDCDSARGHDDDGTPYAWYDYIGTLKGSADRAALCAGVGPKEDDDVSGTGDGGNWPDRWSDEVYEEFSSAMLADARERGYPDYNAQDEDEK